MESSTGGVEAAMTGAMLRGEVMNQADSQTGLRAPTAEEDVRATAMRDWPQEHSNVAGTNYGHAAVRATKHAFHVNAPLKVVHALRSL